MIAGLLLFALGQGAPKVDPLPKFDDYMLTKTTAYTVMSPQHIVGEKVRNTRWFPDSKQLLVVRRVGDDQGMLEADIWTAANSSVKKAAIGVRGSEVVDIATMSGGAALIVVTIPDIEGAYYSLYRISSGSTVAEKMFTSALNEYTQLEVNSDSTLAAVIYSAGEGVNLQILDANAGLGPRTVLPPDFLRSSVSFDAQNKIHLRKFEGQSPTGEVVEYVLGPTGPQRLPSTTRPDIQNPPRTKLKVTSNGGTFTSNQYSAKATGLFMVETGIDAEDSVSKLNSPFKTFAKLSSDGEFGAVSPNQKMVVYVSYGSAFIRKIESSPREAFMTKLEAYVRQQTMMEAKQTALGLILYASDMDDELPAANSDWRKAIEPYIKNNGQLDNFVYTYGSGNLSRLTDPANTELGYVDTAFGRATAYADGHVKWSGGKP